MLPLFLFDRVYKNTFKSTAMPSNGKPDGLTNLLAWSRQIGADTIGGGALDLLQNGPSTSGEAVSHSGNTVHCHHKGSEKAANVRSSVIMACASHKVVFPITGWQDTLADLPFFLKSSIVWTFIRRGSRLTEPTRSYNFSVEYRRLGGRTAANVCRIFLLRKNSFTTAYSFSGPVVIVYSMRPCPVVVAAGCYEGPVVC